MKKAILTASVLVLFAAAAQAGGALCPRQPSQPGSAASVIAPTVYRTMGDLYNRGPAGALANVLVGTVDPCTPSCIGAHPTCAGHTYTVGRAAYVGSLENPFGSCMKNSVCTAGAVQYSGGHPDTDGNDLVSIFVFDGSKIPKGSQCWLKVSNSQNFMGLPYRLEAKVMENRGDGLLEPGAEGCFNGTGPFGGSSVGAAGSLATCVADARGNGSNVCGSGHAQVAANGPLIAHPTCPAGGNVYLTFDRSYYVPLGNLDCAAAAAAKTADYMTCRYSCSGTLPVIRNVDCTIPVHAPLYVGVWANFSNASTMIQDTLTSDNLLHLMGDCDFASENAPGDSTRVDLVCSKETGC